MQVKVFEAEDMTSGLKKVKEALGPDALILSTKTIRRGKLGVMGKSVMEITAAVDNNFEQPKKTMPPRPQRSYSLVEEEEAADITYDKLWSEEKIPASVSPVTDRFTADNEVKSELAELRTIIEGLRNQLQPTPAQNVRRPSIEPEYRNIEQSSDPMVTFLCNKGINVETAKVVTRFSRDITETGGEASQDHIQQSLAASMARLFKTNKVLDCRLHQQKRMSLIGPTGVGKTTTIAKIAANYLSQFGGKIALVTIDTYRIAAVEQLKVYGEIMKLPVEVVINTDGLEKALDKFTDYDLILIDTAGRSPKNDVDLEEMAGFLNPRLQIENHLLLSATTRERELLETINRFSILPISHFIFSKLDECDQLGVLLNIHYKNDTPISFLTNGQRVPEDILTPTPTMISNLIMNESGI